MVHNWKYTPPKYFDTVRWDVGWQVLQKFGIKVKKRGNRSVTHAGDFITLCPFHDEKSPSMYFYGSGQFHCYGCGAHGDVFEFISKMLGTYSYGSKIKAYRWLKKNYGLTLPWERGESYGSNHVCI